MQAYLRNLFAMAVTSVWITLALSACGHRYDTTKIVDGHNVPAANRYRQEFAEALSVSAQWNTGEPLSEPVFYFPFVSGPMPSPDGVFFLIQNHNLKDGFHELILSRTGDQTAEIILVIQEADPGSGTSHAYQWSRDSKAVFVYGSGRPAGQSLLRNAALVYDVDEKLLYSVDIAPLLTERLKDAKK
jgi:hypothetical protein